MRKPTALSPQASSNEQQCVCTNSWRKHSGVQHEDGSGYSYPKTALKLPCSNMYFSFLEKAAEAEWRAGGTVHTILKEHNKFITNY